MRQLTILRGIQGSGKSTFAKTLEEAVIVSADHYFEKPHGGFDYNPAKLPQAERSCFKNFLELTGNGHKHIVVDNMNPLAEDIAPYYLVGLARRYEISIVTMICEPKVALRRNIHNVPWEDIWKIYTLIKRERLPKEWLCEVVENN